MMKSKLGTKLQDLCDEEWCHLPLHRIAWRIHSNGSPTAFNGEYVDHEFISRERPVQCQQDSKTGKANRGWDDRRKKAAREGWPNDHSRKAITREEYLEKKRIYAQKYRDMLK